jgi:hypothetical protein
MVQHQQGTMDPSSFSVFSKRTDNDAPADRYTGTIIRISSRRSISRTVFEYE